MAEETFTITLERKDGYQFLTDFNQPGVAPLLLDEPPPVGEGGGPGPLRLLAASVGDCLSSSALFCLQRSRIEVRGMRTEVDLTLARNEEGRLRVAGIAVRIVPEVAEEDVPRMKRCLDIFEDYCTVTGSVRTGIAVEVAVEPNAVVSAQD
jgi:uncharacterized OsmC-like protein